MTPRIPDNPDEIRRVADELLRTAIPDDITRTDGIIDIVELIARGMLEQVENNPDDRDLTAPGTRIQIVRIHDAGDDPRDDGSRIGAVEVSEIANVRTELPATLRRIVLDDRREYLGITKIVRNDEGQPFASIIMLAGICPDDAGDQAGEPFVIMATANRDGDRVITQGSNGEDVRHDKRAPGDLVEAIEALYDVARRSA